MRLLPVGDGLGTGHAPSIGHVHALVHAFRRREGCSILLRLSARGNFAAEAADGEMLVEEGDHRVGGNGGDDLPAFLLPAELVGKQSESFTVAGISFDHRHTVGVIVHAHNIASGDV